MKEKPDISPAPLRILGLEVSNIKKISYIEIAPKSRLVGLYGKNGSGKTSTLDSIIWALGGAKHIQLQPIRKGHDKAHVRLAIGDKVIEFIITRILKEGRKPELIVESAAGALYPKPQEFVNGLLGAISLDPLEFIQMDPKKRMDTLKAIVKLDVDVEELDRQNDGDFKRRTDVNRDIERLKQQVQLYAGGVKPEMDVMPIDTNALMDEMSKASDHNAALERLKFAREQMGNEIRAAEQAVRDIDTQIERLKAEREKRTLEIGEMTKMLEHYVPIGQPIDVTELGEKIKRAQSENTLRQLQRTARDRYEAAKKELEAEVQKRDQLTAAMDARKERKAAAIASAKFPVDGLGFSDDGVMLGGVPFDQASMAQKIRASFGVAAAMSPRMPVVLIREYGALLDDDNMALLEELAHAEKCQVWIERQKATEGERGDVIVLQEGEIVEVDGQPVKQS